MSEDFRSSVVETLACPNRGVRFRSTLLVMSAVAALACGTTDAEREPAASAPPASPGAGDPPATPSVTPTPPAPVSETPAPSVTPGGAGAEQPNAEDIQVVGAGENPASTPPAAEGPVVLPAPDQPGPFEVLVEENVGVGFENPINANDLPGAGFCALFAASFGGDPEETAEFVALPPDLDISLYTLFRPAQLAEGQTYPVLTWGNGTCALPGGYGTLLRHVASHGFIVIAANSRWVGSGEPQRGGVDWLLQENERADSALFGKIDAERIGAFGHSQGGASTGIVGRDERVDTTILLNGGGTGDLNGPVFLLTGVSDLNPAGVRSAYDGARVPAAFINLEMSDHITLITEPARVVGSVTAWFRYQLLGDAESRGWFVGDDCTLCGASEPWEFLSKDLE
jgi:hypothetical protein